MVQIVVQGVPFAYAWQELKDLFKPLGAVKADIVMGSDRRSKGWGTVLFDSETDAENAIKVMEMSACGAHRCACRGNASTSHAAALQALSMHNIGTFMYNLYQALQVVDGSCCACS